MEILDMTVTALIVIIAAIYLVKNLTRDKGCSSCDSCREKTGSDMDCCHNKTLK